MGCCSSCFDDAVALPSIHDHPKLLEQYEKSMKVRNMGAGALGSDAETADDETAGRWAAVLSSTAWLPEDDPVASEKKAEAALVSDELVMKQMVREVFEHCQENAAAAEKKVCVVCVDHAYNEIGLSAQASDACVGFTMVSAAADGPQQGASSTEPQSAADGMMLAEEEEEDDEAWTARI
jgi:hypothetical protein